eukprot:scpid100355/ scgid24740/ 
MRLKQFPDEFLTVDLGKLHCSCCREELPTKKSSTSSHVKSVKHLNAKKKKETACGEVPTLSERYEYVYEEINEGQATAAALDEDEAYYNRTPSQLCWALSSN